ncbi:hypothetical protein [Enterococcus diestrammenae]|uniref:hypothetical protein n=1 Tax=Enterococcus diestrammenae TaxID=1155073 RepID=UPI0022E5EADB|nr:hypothetical protein [Enterococcus diestrammenae]
MKKKFLIMALLLTSVLGGQVAYASKYVPSHYEYDKNIFTGAETKYETQYRYIPGDYYFLYTNRSQVGDGWNYIRYRITYVYGK